MFGQQVRAVQVDLHDLKPGFTVAVFKGRRRAQLHGGVHQAVEAAKFLFDILRHIVIIFFGRAFQVERINRRCRIAGLLDFIVQVFQKPDILAEQNDSSASLGESQRHGFAIAAGAAGDEDNLVFQAIIARFEGFGFVCDLHGCTHKKSDKV